jgi:hypothetical protein
VAAIDLGCLADFARAATEASMSAGRIGVLGLIAGATIFLGPRIGHLACPHAGCTQR